jgi:AcrR family transcriptional regulator
VATQLTAAARSREGRGREGEGIGLDNKFAAGESRPLLHPFLAAQAKVAAGVFKNYAVRVRIRIVPKMAKARARSSQTSPRRLPRGRHALAPEQVLEEQRGRLLAAVPAVAAERGYEAMTVADIVKRAAVSRNAFYRNFKDKRDCFATAHEGGHERLFEILTAPCEADAPLAERVEHSLTAALEALTADPDMGRLLFVEAPSAGEDLALRYHEWLRRYGRLLQSADAGTRPGAVPPTEIDEVIVGGIASRIASYLLRGEAERLRELTPHFVSYVLAFYRSEPGPAAGQVIPLEAEQPPQRLAAKRRRAGA